MFQIHGIVPINDDRAIYFNRLDRKNNKWVRIKSVNCNSEANIDSNKVIF
jgi:hypothetical protein